MTGHDSQKGGFVPPAELYPAPNITSGARQIDQSFSTVLLNR